jgi:hypothetical protein
LETVQLLLKAGADPNATNDRGESPLHAAVSGDGNPRIVAALLAAGAKTNVTNEEGETPVRVAATRGEQALYEMLLAASGGKEPLPAADPASPAHGKSTSELLKALQSQDYKTRTQARRELTSRGRKIMPEVLESLEKGERVEYVLDLLGAMGQEVEAALPKLEKLSRDKAHAAYALITINRIKPGQMQKLSQDTRRRAAQAIYERLAELERADEALFQDQLLAQLGDDVAIPHFLKLLRSEKRAQQYIATEALSSVPFANAEIQQELVRLAREARTITSS